MKYLLVTVLLGGISISMLNFQAKSQTLQVKPSLFEGVVAAGYIDHGATLNFTGPAIKFSKKPFSLLTGMLPSLKFKKDNPVGNATKNALMIPSLGFGATLIYKHIAFQVPFLYNAKTASTNGKWNAGVGLGYKF
ncbi:hypothetical protein [Pedobacter sp. JY14-1]|uniref:hypothetical protein n=1 Tax=Pedobacter sp. JY14-1 TaxID=3034151 RepID=UPI0023E1A064|nr:hypothetical protein [Pedobacter sp. JY14-1]